MRKFLYISFCFLSILLGSCNLVKDKLSYQHQDSQKLICAQVLNKTPDNQLNCHGECKVADRNTTAPSKLISGEQPVAANRSQISKTSKISYKILRDKLKVQAQRYAKQHSLAAENIDPDLKQKNPYTGPLLWSLGVALLWAINWITLINTIDLFGGFGLLLVPFFTFPMIVLLLILNLVVSDKEDFTKDRVVSSSIAWFYALITFLVSLTTLADFPSILPLLLSLLLLSMMVIYFVKWVNAIQELKSAMPPNKPGQKKHNLIQLLLCLCCLGTLYLIAYSMGFPWFTPLLTAGFITVCAAFFLLWLYRLKPKPRETVFFIGFLLAALIGLISLAVFSFPGPITWLISILISVAFLALWIKNLKDWRKENPDK